MPTRPSRANPSSPPPARPRTRRRGQTPPTPTRITSWKKPIAARPHAHPKFTPEEVALALKTARGLVAIAARKLRCGTQLVRNYIKKYEVVRETQDEARTFLVDTAESKLHAAVQKGAPWAICFTLKCLGKDRGYIERQEHTGAGGVPLASGETVIVVAGDTRDYIAKLREFRDALRTRQAIPISAPEVGGNGHGSGGPEQF
jgi:hypothetical protein